MPEVSVIPLRFFPAERLNTTPTTTGGSWEPGSGRTTTTGAPTPFPGTFALMTRLRSSSIESGKEVVSTLLTVPGWTCDRAWVCSSDELLPVLAFGIKT